MTNPVPHQSAVLGYPVTHYSYVVPDLEKAANFWAEVLGAGPFFLFDKVDFDEIERPAGGPMAFNHSAALGQWGPLAIELEQIESIRPPELAEVLAPHTPGINHASCVCADLDADSARLEELGHPLFLSARTGDFDLRFHNFELMGHALELYRENDFVHGFFAALRNAAEGWDGSEPLRAGLPPM
jgi:catechol 2,3-dioxygenase-like lactoylglutathione lyase family enzyme